MIERINGVRQQRRAFIVHRSECAAAGFLGVMLRISQLVGIAPVLLKKTNEGPRAVLSTTLYVFNMIRFTILNLMLMYVYGSFLNENLNNNIWKSQSGMGLLVFSLTIELLMSSFAIYGSLGRIKKIMNCLNEIDKIKKAKGIDQTKRASLEKNSAWLYAICALCFVIGLLYQLPSISDRNPFFCIFMDHLYAVMFLVVMEYVLVTFDARSSLLLLNDQLEQIYLQCDNIEHVNSSDMYLSIRSLIAMYIKIFEVVRRLYKSYGTVLVLQLILCAIHMVITVFFILPRDVGLFEAVAGVHTGLFRFGEIIMITEISHRTQSELSRTRRLVASMTLECHDERTTAELFAFSKSLVLSKREASAGGVCRLMRPLVATIISYAITYLLVVMQFHNTSRAQHED